MQTGYPWEGASTSGNLIAIGYVHPPGSCDRATVELDDDIVANHAPAVVHDDQSRLFARRRRVSKTRQRAHVLVVSRVLDPYPLQRPRVLARELRPRRVYPRAIHRAALRDVEHARARMRA